MNGDGRTSEPSATPRPAPNPDSPTPKSPEFRWQALFQKARDAVFVLNRRRRILFVNRAWEGLTGLSATELRSDADLSSCSMRCYLVLKNASAFSFRPKHMILLANIQPVLDARGQSIRPCSTVRNV